MHADFVNGALGGALIGLAALAMAGLLGRIAGISGLFWQCLQQLKHAKGLVSVPVAFTLGLLLGGVLVHRVFGVSLPPVNPAPAGLIIAAGLLVGMGTRLGSGCTSGHGVCGIARLSPRSLSATLTFMATAASVVFVVRHGLGA